LNEWGLKEWEIGGMRVECVRGLEEWGLNEWGLKEWEIGVMRVECVRGLEEWRIA
jgi:hypothetical protein